MTDMQQRHIDQLTAENVGLAQDKCRLNRDLRRAHKRSLVDRVFCVLCIGLAAAGGGLWWGGVTDRAQQAESITVLSNNYNKIAASAQSTKNAADTLSSLWPLTVRGFSAALSSEQGKAGTLDMMNKTAQKHLQTCYRETTNLRQELYETRIALERARNSAEQARSKTFTGSIETGK